MLNIFWFWTVNLSKQIKFCRYFLTDRYGGFWIWEYYFFTWLQILQRFSPEPCLSEIAPFGYKSALLVHRTVCLHSDVLLLARMSCASVWVHLLELRLLLSACETSALRFVLLLSGLCKTTLSKVPNQESQVWCWPVKSLLACCASYNIQYL